MKKQRSRNLPPEDVELTVGRLDGCASQQCLLSVNPLERLCIAQLIEDHQVQAQQARCNTSSLALCLLLLRRINQIHR